MIVKVRRRTSVKKTAGWLSRVLRHSDVPVEVRFSDGAAPVALRVVCLAQRHIGVSVPVEINQERDPMGRVIHIVRIDAVSQRGNMRPAPPRREYDEKRSVLS